MKYEKEMMNIVKEFNRIYFEKISEFLSDKEELNEVLNLTISIFYSSLINCLYRITEDFPEERKITEKIEQMLIDLTPHIIGGKARRISESE